jgi:N-ethylmaleimide reductase
MADLFSKLTVGAMPLDHRVAMAPLTRMRAVAPAYAPTDMMVEYYSQRASGGALIITEATHICQSARGAPDTPGIYTDAQIAGWHKVTEAIHAKGGLVVMQLWHMGRLSHAQYQPDHGAPFAPSAIAANAEVSLPDRSRVACPPPRAYSTEEIATLIDTYVTAARSAMSAGFDGVEIHAANGYLLEQFLQSRTNARTNTAARSKTAAALCSRSPKRLPPRSAGQRSGYGSRLLASPMTAARTIPSLSTPI